MVPSTATPEVYVTIEHKRPRLDTLSFPITGSICLDFAFPSSFTSLHDRPAVILGPARTWDPAVALAMWDQAKARAKEVDGTLVWCDGGAGGVSGIAGQGLDEVTQVGSGSWMRSFSVERPFNGRARTLFNRLGEFEVLLIILGLTGMSQLTQLVTRASGQMSWIPLSARELVQRLQRSQDTRGETTERGEDAPLLGH